MSKLVVSVIVSLDGYFEGPDNNVMVMPMDGFFDSNNLERMRNAGTLLYGGKTYRGFKEFWPQMADHEMPSQREISAFNQNLPKYVVSDSLTEDETDPWRETTTIVRRDEAHETVAKLREQPGKDILMFGSGTLYNDLLAAGLVDELYVMIGSKAVGGGTPAFRTPVDLRLLDTSRQEGSENVLLHYEVIR